jgi:uncharacterized protein YlxW (UPF0749 family)
MNQRASGNSNGARAGSSATTSMQGHAGTVDASGGAIISLLQQAADQSKQDCDRAFSMAHELSLQLRAAEDRANTLHAQVKQLEDRAQKAEHWLSHIHAAIEQKFLSPQEAKGQRR